MTRSTDKRVISHNEVNVALTCWARHAFAFTGHLTNGETLRPKQPAAVLSEGRAWGAGVAAWHQRANDGTLLAGWFAHEALIKSLDADYAAAREAGAPPLAEALIETRNRLCAMLDHYMATTEPLPNLTRIEDAFEVGVPSRTGKQASTRFRFSGYIDGWTDDDGRPWIVEFKLRRRLTEPALLERQRQIRWYAWAYGQKKGVTPIGVIVDERLNEVPKPARLTDKGRKPSHAKDQLTTPESYMDLCHEHGVAVNHVTVEHLRQREWQRRFPVMFRPGELEEAGRELVSAARLISDLDGRALEPIRHATPMTCNSCPYKEICSNPGDTLFVDSLFTRTIPKRLR